MVEVKALVIGKDVWWDHTLREFRKRRFNLEKIPLKYRCPNCGRILVQSRHRHKEDANFHLSYWGGVCQKCYLWGFGNYGNFGKFLGDQLRKEDEKYKVHEHKNPLWINGKLKLVNHEPIEPEYKVLES